MSCRSISNATDPDILGQAKNSSRRQRARDGESDRGFLPHGPGNLWGNWAWGAALEPEGGAAVRIGRAGGTSAFSILSILMLARSRRDSSAQAGCEGQARVARAGSGAVRRSASPSLQIQLVATRGDVAAACGACRYFHGPAAIQTGRWASLDGALDAHRRMTIAFTFLAKPACACRSFRTWLCVCRGTEGADAV